MSKHEIFFPREYLRSNLFSISTSPASQEIEAVAILLESQSHVEITTTVKLDLYDRRVFFACWWLARAGGWTPITICAVANFIDDDSAEGLKHVGESMRRVSKSIISISTRERIYRHGMMGWDENLETGKIKIRVDPDLLQQIKNEKLGGTLIDLNDEKKLGRVGLANWLGPYLLTHSVVKPILVSEIHRLSGSTVEMKYFKRYLKIACSKLVICGLYAEVVGKILTWHRIKVEADPEKPVENKTLSKNGKKLGELKLTNPELFNEEFAAACKSIFKVLVGKDFTDCDFDIKEMEEIELMLLELGVQRVKPLYVSKLAAWARADQFWRPKLVSADYLFKHFNEIIKAKHRSIPIQTEKPRRAAY